MDKIRFGVIGLRFGRNLVSTLAHLDDAQLIAVADRSTEFPLGIEAYAARYGAKAYKDSGTMLEHEELDAIIVATSPRRRAEVIEQAAKLNLPMFVEKPWATNLDHAQELATLCKQHNATVMLGFSFRFLPAITRLKALMAGELGAGWMLNGNYTFSWIVPSEHWLWSPENGNGFFNENSGHLFDAVCYLMGKPVSVMAEGGNFTNSPSEDSAAVTMRFENGGIAALTIGGIGTGAISNYPQINVYTANGQAQLNGEGHIWKSLNWTTRGDATTQTLTTSPEALGDTRYTHAIKHFIECIRSGEQPTATIEDGVTAVALAEAVYESARTGKKVIL